MSRWTMTPPYGLETVMAIGVVFGIVLGFVATSALWPHAAEVVMAAACLVVIYFALRSNRAIHAEARRPDSEPNEEE